MFVILGVAATRCAIPVAQVREVLRLPRALSGERNEQTGLLGFTVLRGRPSAVFDLAVLLGLRSTPVRSDLFSMRLVRLSMGDQTPAVVVDEVIGVQALARTQLRGISLPGGREVRFGRFDQDFARLVEASGLIPADAGLSGSTPAAAAAGPA